MIFEMFADRVMTRRHRYKLFRRYSGVNASKSFYVNRLCNI